MKNRLAALALAASLCVLPGTARAFDGVRAIATALPIGQQSAEDEFYFMDPSAVRTWPPSDWPGIGISELLGVMIDADLGLQTVGISFPELYGIASFGTVPQMTIHLVGEDISAETVGEALLLRPGMEETERDGVAVFAEGDDYGTDPAAMDSNYPFGGGWRSHRVAVADGRALVSFSWPDLDDLLTPVFHGVEPGGDGGWSFGDLIDAAAEQAPAGAVAFAASGLPTRAFVRSGELDPGAASVPAFAYAVHLGWTQGNREGAQMILAYDDADDAEAAAAALAARLESDRLGGAWPAETKIVSAVVELRGGGVAAIASLLFPPFATDHLAVRRIEDWHREIFSGRLGFIAVAP